MNKSNIYICKESTSLIFEVIIGEKYIIESISDTVGDRFINYHIFNYKNNELLGAVFNLPLDTHFITVEKDRENKLNLLFNEI